MGAELLLRVGEDFFRLQRIDLGVDVMLVFDIALLLCPPREEFWQPSCTPSNCPERAQVEVAW